MTILKPLLWILVVAVSGIPPAAATPEIDWSDYRWKHRLLFIFAPSTSDATFLALDKRLAQTALEIEDRDMIIFRIFENNPSRVSDKPLLPGDEEALRRRFGIEPGRFTVVLVGKDGGVKMVAHRDADLQSIFNLIDSMPMRQQEMRDKRSKHRTVTAVPLALILFVDWSTFSLIASTSSQQQRPPQLQLLYSKQQFGSNWWSPIV